MRNAPRLKRGVFFIVGWRVPAVGVQVQDFFGIDNSCAHATLALNERSI